MFKSEFVSVKNMAHIEVFLNGKFFEFSKVDKLLNEAQAERQKVLDNDSNNYDNLWFP